jgi:hypothetical protein
MYNITEQLDFFAEEMFGEFGFATCSVDEQEIILKKVYQIRFL